MRSRNDPRAAGGFVRGNPPGVSWARRSLVAAAVVTVALFALLAQFGENGVVTWWRLRAEEAALRREVDDLARANAAQAARLEALAEDPEALERLAREEYGMRREDEEVLTVLPAARDPRDP